MQVLPTVIAAALAAIQTSPSPARLTRSDSVLVTSVLDGRTIAVARLGHVRLVALETPAPIAREARDRLAALVLHRWVRLEQESTGFDSYRRRLAYIVRDDGLFVNAAMVREGLARVAARGPLTRLDELKRAESEAQRSRSGVWGHTAPAAPRYTRRLRVPRMRHAKERKFKDAFVGRERNSR